MELLLKGDLPHAEVLFGVPPNVWDMQTVRIEDSSPNEKGLIVLKNAEQMNQPYPRVRFSSRGLAPPKGSDLGLGRKPSCPDRTDSMALTGVPG